MTNEMNFNNENVKTNLDFALAYAQKGWPVFPLHSIRNGQCSCGNSKCGQRSGKHPRTEHGLNDATTDEQQITRWWNQTPDANIGVRTGRVSGISVLDIDQDKGGFDSVKEFEVPNTLYSKTGGDGQHHIFQYNEKIPTTTAFRSGIDFRSEGAYIVAPPSNHISGKTYVWVDESLERVPAPEWMKTKGHIKTTEPLPAIFQDGSRNSGLTSIAGSMRAKGASKEDIEKALIEENKKRCCPPLDDEEVLTIAKSVSRYEPNQDEGDEVDSVLLSKEQVNQVKARVESIPKDCDPTDLPNLVNPILKDIAGLNIAQGDAILKSIIKEHFGFKNGELASYEKVLKSYRKEPKDDNRKSLGQDELIQKLHDDQGVKTIHPAQDYTDGVMTFAVKAQDTPCLVTSDKKLFTFEDAISEGFDLKHETVDTARFSPQGIEMFIKGKCDVNISSLYQRVYGYIKRFIVLPDEAYLSYLTLWVIGTYIFKVFRYYPYVWLNAEKESGKTHLMSILAKIAFNGDLTTHPTESVIFRDISNNLITMFIDEVEKLSKRDKDAHSALISILNVGFCNSGVVKRSESNGNGGFSVKQYNVYSPKMFAGINELDDVLQARTFRIPLLRKKDGEIIDRYKDTNGTAELQRTIRDDLYVFALTHAKDIAELYNEEGAIKGLGHLTNRELDIWEPILLMANLVDSQSSSLNITDLMQALSKKSLEDKQAESVAQNDTYTTLNVLKAMLGDVTALSEDENGDVKVFDAGQVFHYFKNTEEFSWIEKPNVLTRRLKRVKVTSDQKRVDGQKKRIYIVKVKEFIDLCERFKI